MKLRDADGEGDRPRILFGMRKKRDLGKPYSQPLRRDEGVLGGGLGEENQELLPAVPEAGIHRAEVLPDRVAKGPEDLVPLVVAERVVVLLEPVHIHEQDREGHTVSLRAHRLVLRQGVEVAPIVELGEGVRDRLETQFLIEGLAGGDVGEESDEADLLSVFPQDGAGQANGGFLPALPQDLRLEVHEVTERTVLRRIDVIPHFPCSAGRVQTLGVQLSDDFLRRIPEDPFRALVVQEDVSPRVVRDDPFGAGRDHVFEEGGSTVEGAQEGVRGICGRVQGCLPFKRFTGF